MLMGLGAAGPVWRAWRRKARLGCRRDSSGEPEPVSIGRERRGRGCRAYAGGFCFTGMLGAAYACAVDAHRPFVLQALHKPALLADHAFHHRMPAHRARYTHVTCLQGGGA